MWKSTQDPFIFIFIKMEHDDAVPENEERFLIELEFVQNLANVGYLISESSF